MGVPASKEEGTRESEGKALHSRRRMDALCFAKHRKAQHGETLFPASTFSRKMGKLRVLLV